MTGLRLFAQHGDAFLEPGKTLAVHPVPGRGLARILIHAHIERAVANKTESAPCFIKLQGRNANIQQRAVYLVPAKLCQRAGKIAVIAVEKVCTVAKNRQPLFCQRHGFFVAVESAQFYSGSSAKHGRGVTAQAKGSIQIPPTRTRRKSLQRFSRQHRHMPRGFCIMVHNFCHGRPIG